MLITSLNSHISAVPFSSSKKNVSEESKTLNVSASSCVKPSVEHLKANFISFGRQEDPALYDKDYATKDDYNGKTPEKYLKPVLSQYFPLVPYEQVNILDIGAGDGRNTIPLAKLGCNLTATELSSTGRDKIDSRAKAAGLEDTVNVLGVDILEKDQLEQIQTKQDFIFMSRVSQHFSEADLKTALKNLSEILKPGGVIVFDALIQNPNYVAGAFEQKNMQNRGIANHNMLRLLNNIEDAGLKLESVSDYEFAPKEELAEYLVKENPGWGLAKNNISNQDVRLQLFVLKGQTL